MYFSSAAVLGFALPCALAQTWDISSLLGLPLYSASIDSTATAQKVVYNPTAAAASVAAEITGGGPSKRAAPAVKKRTLDGDCSALPLGSGPVPSVDTAAFFEADPDFTNFALNTTTPTGYTETFVNLNCSSNAYGYMGFQTLDTYDAPTCGAICDATVGCVAFNICTLSSPF